jgi:hypothetical protein
MLTVGLPGVRPEVFDNIGGDPATFWQALANAVNAGVGAQRMPSRLITFQSNGNTSTPVGFSVNLGSSMGGDDGAGGVSAVQLVGRDGTARTGMYALRGQGCGIALLADADDPQTWPDQTGFGLDEGVYMILTGPAGDTIANAVTTKYGIGLDDYSSKLMFGDWLWWLDQSNSLTRLVSPQGFTAGRLSNLSPEQSSLNKPIYGIIGSQSLGQPFSGETSSYSAADLATLLSAGIDVITNPQPAGSFWGVRGGKNSSSDIARNGDNYTRLTNYIARTLALGMGKFIGQVITATLFQGIRGTFVEFHRELTHRRTNFH